MRRNIAYLFIIVLLAACRDNYELPLREDDVSLLVVEGVLNAGQGQTRITLSKTVKVTEATLFKPELNATVTVEGKTSGNFKLTDNSNGYYTHSQLPLVPGQEYRLRIKTSNNKEYVSDYMIAKQTPEIDALSWKKENEGVRISVNTHDASNKTRYYKWDFDETWEIASYYKAFYRWVSGTTIVPAPGHNYSCWKYANSNSIIIGSTAQLEADVVKDAPVQFVLPNAERLSVRYSILVRQQSLTKEAYEYFQLMKKNTESIGTIFDPQPSELRGNIKCITNPDENVIGYITASTFTQKRLFITAAEASWKFTQNFESIKVANNPDSLKIWLPGYLPYDAQDGNNGTEFYFLSLSPCVDCTKRGGDLNKPSYW